MALAVGERSEKVPKRGDENQFLAAAGLRAAKRSARKRGYTNIETGLVPGPAGYKTAPRPTVLHNPRGAYQWRKLKGYGYEKCDADKRVSEFPGAGLFFISALGHAPAYPLA